MICVKCGNEIPDASSFCAQCGSSQNNSVPPKETVAHDFGDFFREYFRNPVKAITDRADQAHFLWGAAIFVVYLIMVFLFSVPGSVSRDVSLTAGTLLLHFIYLLSGAVRFATLIFVFWGLQHAFHFENKISLPATVSLTGLSFLPIVPFYLIGSLFSNVIHFYGIAEALDLALYAGVACILFAALSNVSREVLKNKVFFTVIIAVGSMPLIESLLNLLASRVYGLLFF